MQVAEPRFVSRMARPEPAIAASVSTPVLGDGVVLVSDRAMQAVWEDVEFPAVRRGSVAVEARILVDGDGAWVPQAVLLSPSGSQPLDGPVLRAVRDGVAACIGGEVLAAASEALLAHPEATVEAIRNGASGVEDEIVATAVTRVIERLETDTRLQRIERDLGASLPDGEPTPREALEEAARQMRSSGYAF